MKSNIGVERDYIFVDVNAFNSNCDWYEV